MSDGDARPWRAEDGADVDGGGAYDDASYGVDGGGYDERRDDEYGEGGADELGGEEGEEEEEDEEEEMDMVAWGDHPMVARVQEVLRKQLEKKDTAVTEELRETEEELRRARSGREDLGVTLYGVQQQLAKLQMAVESAHSEVGLVSSARSKAEEEVEALRRELEEAGASVEEQRGALHKQQAELDALTATLRQVEKYNEEMRSEIAVTRRATYKAEEAVVHMERDKKKQDLYIDSLNEQLKALREKLALYEAQLVSQKQETQAALDTLVEAGKEMEQISFEKKQLLQHWKSSLIGMQRRDEALQATQDALAKQKEAEQAIDAEIDGYKTAITKEQARNEQLSGTVDRIGSEEKWLEDQLRSIAAERSKLSERYAMLKRSLDSTDREMQRVTTEALNLADQMAVVDKNLQLVVRERQKLEEGIASNKSTQTTVSKAARNLAKTAEKVQLVIHEKELEGSGLKNELSRIKVDSLNTASHNSQLRESLDSFVAELKEKDALIEKYEMEIRQRNDAIEKKMYVVDRLNRRYEQLTGDMEDENTGPLEATIKNLSKQISAKLGEIEEMKRAWLRTQTELVATTNDSESVAGELHELSARETILVQKRMRLDQQIEAHRKETAALRADIAALHLDMVRLNGLIAENRALGAKLRDDNAVLEAEFVEELKEMEEASLALEARVAETKSTKDRLLEEILEVERQIMLWEKKIQLERETQEALDPEVGMAEAKGMEKEIHRMRLRHDALARDQEKLIKEMERAIEKRETIELRYKSRRSDTTTTASLRKRRAALKHQLKATKAETRDCERALSSRLAEMEAVSVELEKGSASYGTLEDDAADLQAAINDSLYEKQRNIDLLSKYHRMAKRYEDARDGRYEPPSAADVETELGHAESEMEAIRTAIHLLTKEFGTDTNLAAILPRVMELTRV
eukprot:PLAT6916.1.p1 GENE.PLAT6916.1~~PLAT6916.1.p1  ORF type:complete len:923 (+),score=651.50 PLAT6916.1:76-2844(+)